MEQDKIIVVFADDHELLLEGFSQMVGKMKEVELLGTARNGEELVKLVMEKQPQIVVTDIQMPVMDGVDAIRLIKQQLPACRVVGLSNFNEIPIVTEAMNAGADGFLLKNVGPEELLTAFKAVLNDEFYYSAEVERKMFRRKFPDLTDREKEIMKLIVKEKSSKEIAEILFISMRTVEKHRHSLERKIGTKSVVGIAVFATKNGYV